MPKMRVQNRLLSAHTKRTDRLLNDFNTLTCSVRTVKSLTQLQAKLISQVNFKLLYWGRIWTLLSPQITVGASSRHKRTPSLSEIYFETRHRKRGVLFQRLDTMGQIRSATAAVCLNYLEVEKIDGYFDMFCHDSRTDNQHFTGKDPSGQFLRIAHLGASM
ncbi:hypothetical protein F2P81_015035 [Scophthalmus maximus]|uniref:Uncharacterized protein n=1 Tax=Scophthalmus maximus TaxID=52904 RepID=A0A6A4SJH1_SCOMX|nr:hypothetical protein F2P81_015035 [Scophthalmus maximus]